MHFDTLAEWLAWQESLHPVTIDLGLGRSERVYAALNPERAKPLTITVAGTNGKGSCVAFLEAIYRAQGYRVGAYTSPHILRYNERIKIDGEPVADDLICAAFARIEAVRGEHSLSYFEFGTLAALDIFARAELDIQLLEVGLGGRLDAVNIIDPDIAIISSIGIDHVYWLGETREAIGREKAGIFRRGIPAIVGDPNPPESVTGFAAEISANLYQIGKQFNYEHRSLGWSWRGNLQELSDLPEPVLKGEHQYRNAAAVIQAVLLLDAQLPVSEAAIQAGLQQAKLPGRFQLILGNVPVLLDVGHNPEAVKTLVEHLAAYYGSCRILAVFSMMKDKDIGGVLALMKPLVEHWYFVPLANPRAATESLMYDMFLQNSMVNVSFNFVDFADAFNTATSHAKAGDLILVFGSFLLVSDCLHEFDKRELTK